MFFPKGKDNTGQYVKSYIKSQTFQITLISILTVLIAFVIIIGGAAPKKYRLNLWDKSQYDIIAPRDIENEIKTEQKRKEAYAAEPQVTKEITTAPIEVLNNTDDFFTVIESARKSVQKSLSDQGITPKSKNYKSQLELFQELAFQELEGNMKSMNIPLSKDQVKYLITKTSDEDMAIFKRISKELISNIMKEDITLEDLANKVSKVQNSFQGTSLNQDLINIGSLMAKSILEPNREIDVEQTEIKKMVAYDRPENVVKILKGSRIISYGEIVTEDILQILEELNLLETKSRFDIGFVVSLLIIIVLLALLLISYIRHFCRSILNNKSDVILLCVIIILTLLISWAVYEYFTPLAIPIFIATMLISILLDLQLACSVNCVLAIGISLIAKGDTRFFYMAMISGVFSAFLVSKASQRSKLSMSGIIVGFINVLIIICFGIINKGDPKAILTDSIVVFLNGVISIVLTIGLLPFLESTFNVITPLKLLELTNPNQPLIKRLLMEAPGTYHHSLMVGNLAEVATEEIGGNALLARVGAYFHDVGKLKRPNFFKENQMSDNPHDRMTANLSTLVITSHVHDGVELAVKNKVPLVIRDIIRQHHGTTLVAYFYHKAKKGEKGETVKQENFRYEGPRPSTKEAAVVMLADSVEAAVRSMTDRTEGKIEGLIRKIIKDKLDDGQLDLCDLTLRDLDSIAKSFMRVLSGYYHEREEYPEIKAKEQVYEVVGLPNAGEAVADKKEVAHEGSASSDSID